MPDTHDWVKFPELSNSQLLELGMLSPHKQITEDFRAVVSEVIDGDTLRLKWDERNFVFRLRMPSIQAPELGDEGGEASKKWLAQQIEGEEVEIMINKNKRVDKWGRLMGNVIYNGLDMGQASIAMGYSVPWAQRHQGEVMNMERELSKIWS